MPFPVWYCQECGETILADESQLPVNPTYEQPLHPCPKCGGTSLLPEEDVMDTWATSSLSPSIAGQWLKNQKVYDQVFPYRLQPRGTVPRTWAFYTIVNCLHHFGKLPWRRSQFSGWGLLPQGMGKISKSRGGGPVAPMEMIGKYWQMLCAFGRISTGFGKDTMISEEKVRIPGTD